MLCGCCRRVTFRPGRGAPRHGPATPVPAHPAPGTPPRRAPLRTHQPPGDHHQGRDAAARRRPRADDARELLTRSEALLATARRIRDGESGLLRAALPPDIAGETVAALLAGFRQRHAGVELELRELTTAQQLDQLAAHDLDVGLIHHPCDVAGLELGPVLRREVGVLLPRGAPAADLDEVPLTALNGYDLVLFHRSGAPALHDDLLTTCARDGYTPTAVRHGQGASFVRGLLLSSRAVAFSPKDAHPAHAAGEDPDIVWRPLAGAPLAWRHSVAWPKGRGDAAVATFAQAVTDALRGTAAATADAPPRPLHLRPTAEYWL
ncbi:putative HTH-type transcriptional regulator AlsR [Streptomyces aurantiacus JA 4570]|uniref:Putative HTH-type transcriptional regulator AlsR n=1 Tax=Streptomyces aurantiacus JA 4570 TaxID=1286094 RepID=S4A211_9ACTN|nr:putative HTH-type transcriptional regulator AlsR [Streptomyces aurantiacus JA 4570]